MYFHTKEILHYWHLIRRIKKERTTKRYNHICLARIIHYIGFDMGLLYTQNIDEVFTIETRDRLHEKYMDLNQLAIELLK